jgi:hypothetical protein
MKRRWFSGVGGASQMARVFERVVPPIWIWRYSGTSVRASVRGWRWRVAEVAPAGMTRVWWRRVAEALRRVNSLVAGEERRASGSGRVWTKSVMGWVVGPVRV